MKKHQRYALLGGPLLAVLGYYGATAMGASFAPAITTAIALLTATWWVFEPIPIPATSLIPFVAFPATGILSHNEVATAYGHSLILLLLGGFMMSRGLEKAGAHRRMAHWMLQVVGTQSPKRLVLGFMLATAICSMWISNTATVLVMMPVALAVLADAEKHPNGKALEVPLLLGIAYAASIGGMGTPVGTPPNVVLMGVYTEITGLEIGFAEWMMIGLPAVIVLLPLTWLWLVRGLSGSLTVSLPTLPAWSTGERRVLAVFGLTALAWVTRTAPFGGWSDAIGVDTIGDSTIALASVLTMFLVSDGRGERLLDWDYAAKIPWGLLILFGGGIALARGFSASGLATIIGDFIAHDLNIAAWPLALMILVLALMVSFLTEITSNTATTTLLMPVLGAAAIAVGIDPKLLMVPAALSASCAFMLPVATAPNAIVFGAGNFSTATMAREGVVLNVACALILTGVLVLTL
jgi:sodium-dependent dicarboxylate transporter 2/3/5